MAGMAEFVTKYTAIVFKPFKGEVVDGIVGDVTKVLLYQTCQGDEADRQAERVLRGCRTVVVFRFEYCESSLGQI
jgi:hypothetical protein